MVQAILFDKDGTLFDFAATWEAWAARFLMRLAEGDREKATQLGMVIGFDLPSRKFASESVVIAGTPGEVAAALIPHVPGAEPDTFLAMINAAAEAAPQAETVPLTPFLDDLKARGLVLGVMTNDAEAVAHKHLDQSGIRDRFAFIAGFDSGFGAKPAPDPLLAFCRAVAIDPAQTVMVGDSTHDLIAGRRAGMRTVGVLTGMADAPTLAPQADVVLPDIGHLPAWLDQAAP